MSAHEISQAEKRRILIEERRLRTYQGHAQHDPELELGGRFAQVNTVHVTGSTPSSSYPRMDSGPWSKNEYPNEPLIDGRGEGNILGYAIDDMSSGSPASVTSHADAADDGSTTDGISVGP